MDENSSFNIWTDYPRLPLPEVLDFIVDNRGKTVPTAPTGHKLIATNCIRNENLYPSYEKIRYLSEETYQTWFRSHPLPGDIIFVCKGTPGRVCMVPDPIDFCIAQDMVALRVNKEIIFNRYLLVVLRSEEIQKQIYNYSVGDVIPHFKKSFFDQLRIPIPPMNIQRRIGDFYFSFSLKIEINNRINQNLEEQAKAIFKSWFVDFEPFKDGKFVDSELGRIPKGWKTGKFTDVVQILGGGTPKTSIPEYWNGMIPFFTPKDVSDSIYTFATEKKLTEDGLNNCNSRLYPENTVFVTARGTVGKLALAGVPMAMNQSCYALVGKNVSPLFVFFLALQVVETLKKIANGAVFDAIVTRDFETKSVIIPPEEAINRFVELIAPIFKMIHSNVIQNTTLVQSRDTLLPKLMSGEIDVFAIKN